MPHIRSDDVVASALRDSSEGMKDAENAAKHGVAVKTIRRWRRLYVRRGVTRGQEHVGAPCPRCDGAVLDTGAYAELFGWYLGDGHLARARRGVYTLSIVNDERYALLNVRIAQLMKLVKPASRPHTRQVPGAVVTTVGWKHWPCLLPQHGPGRKDQRVLSLEEWQEVIVGTHPADFLRGLFHSDGSRFTNWARRGERRHEYGRWMFTNNSSDIMTWCQEALDLIGVHWTMPRWNCLSVARRADVALLDEIIGPKR
ncbi:MAG TPA: transcriptional regulator [Nocardioidaceae bacterium]|nr:transcriptional regulator [Nocardioidaceae bacterium]